MNIAARTIAVLAMLVGSVAAAGADWPLSGRPIQIIVPVSAGGGTGDSIARLLADQLAIQLKTSVVVENRGGANGNVGAAAVAAAPPDGYTLLFSWAGTLAVNPSIYKNLRFDPEQSFDPIALIAETPNILVVNKGLGVTSFEDFVAYARSHPGQLNFGSTGIGSSMHLAAELFMRRTKTSMVHVPYSSTGVATTNLLGNHTQTMFHLIPGIVGQVKAGEVRALAVMAKTRSSTLPDVPAVAELGEPELLSSTWFALLAPRNTSADILDKLNDAVNRILADPRVRERLAAMGASSLGGTRQDLAAHLSNEIAKWRVVVEEAGVTVQ